MKRKTILMLVISIICVLGASTLVYNALAPDDTNYEALSDGSVLENTSPTAYSVETAPPETDTSGSIAQILPEQGIVTAPPSASTTAPPAAQVAPKAAVTTTPGAAAPTTAAPPAAAPRAAQTTAAPKAGNAPDFTVYDGSGNAVKLSDFRGQPVVINFWASWCGPCKAEMPHFQSMYNKYGSSVVFLMVNLTDGSRETKESAQSFISTNGYSFPVYFDTKRSASSAYGISSIPSTFFINKAGDIQSRQIGQINASALESGIQSIQ